MSTTINGKQQKITLCRWFSDEHVNGKHKVYLNIFFILGNVNGSSNKIFVDLLMTQPIENHKLFFYFRSTYCQQNISGKFRWVSVGHYWFCFIIVSTKIYRLVNGTLPEWFIVKMYQRKWGQRILGVVSYIHPFSKRSKCFSAQTRNHRQTRNTTFFFPIIPSATWRSFVLP